jgi:hypothetical protein
LILTHFDFFLRFNNLFIQEKLVRDSLTEFDPYRVLRLLHTAWDSNPEL